MSLWDVVCFVFSTFWWICAHAGAAVGFISIATFLLSTIWQRAVLHFMPAVDFKERYGSGSSSWALVSGGSSGIGLAIVERLCEQGIAGCVIPALGDRMLEKAVVHLREKYPSVKIREVSCDLGASDPEVYMAPIRAATDDIDVRIVFCNAGFITFGLVSELPAARQRANICCNGNSVFELAHHFSRKMLATPTTTSKRGFIGFTCSASAYIPAPSCALYSASKAWLLNFTSGFASEVRARGIDCVTVLPGAIKTPLWQQGKDLPAASAAANFAATPEEVATVFFQAAGRLSLFDAQSIMTIGFKFIGSKLLDTAFFHEVLIRTTHLTPDYKVLMGKVQ